MGDRIGVGCDPQHCIGDNQFVVFELCRRIKNEVILLSDDDDDDDCVVNVPASVQPAVAAAVAAAVDHPAEIHSIVDSTDDDDDEDDDLDNASNEAHDFDMEMSQRHMRDFKQEQIEWDDYCVGVDRIKNESVDNENNNDDNSFHDYSIDDDVVDLCSDDELEILSQRWMPLSQISSNKDVSGPSSRRRRQSTLDLPAYEKKRKIDLTTVKKEMMVPDSVDSTGVVVVVEAAAADPSPTIEVMEWDWNDEQIRAVFSKEPSTAEPVVQPAAAAAAAVESIESDDNEIHKPGTVRAAHRIFDNETDQSDASSINIQRPKAARIGHRIVDTEPEPIDNETAAAPRDERKESSSHRRKSSSSSSRASSSKHFSKKSSKHSKEKSNGHKKSDRIASTSKVYQPKVLLHKITAETSRPAAPEPKIILKQITSAEPKKLPEMLQTAPPPPPPASAPILPPQPSSNAITKMPQSSSAAPTPTTPLRCAPITNRRRTQLIEAKPLEKRRQSCSLNRIKTALKMDDQLKKFKTNIPIGQRTSSSTSSGHGSSKSSKKDVKENRSSKLRQIAEAQKANVVKEPKSKTKPKVKLTVNNRGTFLTEQFDQVPKKTTKNMEQQQLAAGKNRSLVHDAVTPPILEHLVNASMGLSTAAEPIEIPSVFPKSSLKPRVSHVSGGRRPSIDTNRLSIDTAYETAPVPSSAFAPQPSEMVTINSVQPAPCEPMPAAPPAAGTAVSPQQKNLSDYTFIFEPTPRPNSILVNIVQKRKPLRCVRFAENIAEIREFVADANEILERRNHLQNVLQMNAGTSKKRPTNSGLDQAVAVVNDPILDVMKWDPKWLKKLVAIRNAPPPPVNGLDFLLMPLTHKYDSIATFIG